MSNNYLNENLVKSWSPPQRKRCLWRLDAFVRQCHAYSSYWQTKATLEPEKKEHHLGTALQHLQNASDAMEDYLTVCQIMEDKGETF